MMSGDTVTFRDEPHHFIRAAPEQPGQSPERNSRAALGKSETCRTSSGRAANSKPNSLKLNRHCHYQHDGISLAKAAHLAGVSWQQMRDVLLEQGIPVRLGPESLAEAEAEVAALRQQLA